MENPYRIERLHRNLTQKHLAEIANVSYQVVQSLEIGLYQKAPISVQSVLKVPDKDYTDWVKLTRHEHRPLFAPHLINITDHTTWKSFRLSITQSFRGFCRLLLYQPSMLAEYEHRGVNRPSLNQALSDIGMSRNIRSQLLYHKNRSIVS